MSDNSFEIKTIQYRDMKFTVKYFKNVSVEKMKQFLKDTNRLIKSPKTVNKDTSLQQIFHVMLMIKHFTDFKIDTDSIKALKEQSQTMLDTGLLIKIIDHLDKRVVAEINEILAIHNMMMYNEIPKYLALKDFGGKYYKFKPIDKLENEKNARVMFNSWQSTNITPSEQYELLKFYNISPSQFDRQKKKYEQVIPTVDELLDELSDYMKLHKEWQDAQYLERAEHIKRVLKGEERYYGI